MDEWANSRMNKRGAGRSADGRACGQESKLGRQCEREACGAQCVPARAAGSAPLAGAGLQRMPSHHTPDQQEGPSSCDAPLAPSAENAEDGAHAEAAP